MSTQVAKKTRPCVAQVCAFVATLITAAPVAAGQDSRPASVHLAIDQPGALREWQIESVVEQVRLIWGAAGIAVSSGMYGSPSKPDDALRVGQGLVGSRTLPFKWCCRHGVGCPR